MPKILMVLDGEFRFSVAGNTPDFTYVALVTALTAAGHQITKAHRETDAGADFSSFDFSSTVNLLQFDLLWLIGFDGRNLGGTTTKLPDVQLAAIARFMESGGGVFATGDHDSIGADMCGFIPRVRAMRSWFGTSPDDPASPMPAFFPRNFPPFGSQRADTTQLNPAGDYDLNNDGTNDGFVWFENQSDSIPQPIMLVSPTHPIMKRGTREVTVFPDHMHEGNTLGEVPGYDYVNAAVAAGGTTFSEFPMVAGHRELPAVIATGRTTQFSSRFANNNTAIDPVPSGLKTVSSLSVYDGRAVGVGRIVTGSTFHHYVDINLTGDSRIDTASEFALTGPDAAKNHGFNDAPSVFDDIKAVFDNIATWVARPRPKIQLVLDRSTFSQAEAAADPNFAGAILVTVDGLKPNQFPGGGVTTLAPTAAQLASWAPQIVAQEPTGLSVVATSVASDDPTLADRLQRITFSYRVTATSAAFGFTDDFNHVRIDASLGSTAVASPLTDSAQITLVKSANPFMLDLANGNTTPWLSSDVRVFRIVAGAPGSPLPGTATRAQAITHLRTLVNTLTAAQFDALATDETASALSPFATTTGTPSRPVYNFAVARVRLPATGASASDVRVHFRIFTTQTTAALTYDAPGGVPTGGYRVTTGADPVALPGRNGAGTEWLSFPMFAAARAATPSAQTDAENLQATIAPGAVTFFGCLIDNNLAGAYLPPTPGGGAPVDLPTLLMGEHQCVVAEIHYPGTPIPDGANPFTSDKLSQRNIALSAIANPGVDASRTALHTFEIDAAPSAGDLAPDELLLEWLGDPPEGTEVRLQIPSWDAPQVVEVADALYPRHEIRAAEPHTVAIPGGGTRFIPVPPSSQRQTGVIVVQFPLGVEKGQRFDLAVRQISNRGRVVEAAPSVTRTVSREDAARLLKQFEIPVRQPEDGREERAQESLPLGVFELDAVHTLITDLSVINAKGDHALIIEHPTPEDVAVARRSSGHWRETIGAFQLGVPVSVKGDMLPYHLRLLSVLRWRAEHLNAESRWHAAFLRYVELTAEKVRALGGDPSTVPATPTGEIGQEGEHGGVIDPDHTGGDHDRSGSDWRSLDSDEAEWLSDIDDPGDDEATRGGVWSGKVSGLVFDHFADFTGFILETYAGSHRRFISREPAVRDLIETARCERTTVTVITVSHDNRHVRHILVRGSQPE